MCVRADGEAVLPAKKYLMWAGGAFVVLYLLKAPAAAALNVRHALAGLTGMADSLATFVNRLAS